jgi:hypothetical protein
VGADLYGSDATLYTHGDVRRTHTGATDLWATDATLYATHEDRDRANAERAQGGTSEREPAPDRVRSMETAAHDHGGDAGEDADDAVCPVCLGGTSGRDGTDEGDGGTNETEDDDDGMLVATLPCGHRLHLRCALRAVDACVRAGDAPRCPTCRRVATAEAFERIAADSRIDGRIDE